MGKYHMENYDLGPIDKYSQGDVNMLGIGQVLNNIANELAELNRLKRIELGNSCRFDSLLEDKA